MATAEAQMRSLYADLQPGDQVEVAHEVKVGQQRWTTATRGEVVGKERRRHGLHNRRNPDDKVWSDVLVLRQADNSLTTLTMDEYTEIKRV